MFQPFIKSEFETANRWICVDIRPGDSSALPIQMDFLTTDELKRIPQSKPELTKHLIRQAKEEKYLNSEFVLDKSARLMREHRAKCKPLSLRRNGVATYSSPPAGHDWRRGFYND